MVLGALAQRPALAPGHSLHTATPLIGNDTDYVMRDLLGYTAEEVAELKDAEVLY